MTTVISLARARHKRPLRGRTVVVIGGSAGTGLEAPRRARAAGADLILTGRDPEALERAAIEVDARRTAAFDPGDQAALKRFFDDLPGPIDHVLVTAADRALALGVAGHAAGKMRSGGSLLLVGRTRRDGGDAAAVSRPFAAALAVALAPVGVRPRVQ